MNGWPDTIYILSIKKPLCLVSFSWVAKRSQWPGSLVEPLPEVIAEVVAGTVGKERLTFITPSISFGAPFKPVPPVEDIAGS